MTTVKPQRQHCESVIVPGSATPALGDRPADVDPQMVVTFASLGICQSEPDLHCGLTFVPAGRAAETLAATDHVPVRLDWLQNQLRQGPAFTPERSQVLTSTDLASDQRWLDFGRLAVATLGVRSLVSIELALSAGDRAAGDRALLSFYSGDPTALDRMDIGAAVRLARLAAGGVRKQSARLRADLTSVAEGDYSRVAVALSEVMAHHGLNSTEAFDLMQGACGRTNRPLLDLAIAVVRDGHLPQDAPRPRAVVGGPEMWRDRSARRAARVRRVSLAGAGRPAQRVVRLDSASEPADRRSA